MRFSDTFVEVDGCKTHLRRAGKGEPLLFLHGASGAPVILPFMEKLAQRFDVLVPEHPGWGLSDEPAWIVRAWTEPGPFAFQGKHYNVQYVNLWPRPYQKPHPPIWIPSQGSKETIDWASHPDRRYTYLQTFSPSKVVARYLKMYRDTCEGYGYQAKDSQLGWAVPVYVGTDDESARREAKQHFEAFRNVFVRMPLEMLLPPGCSFVEARKPSAKHLKLTGTTCASAIFW